MRLGDWEFGEGGENKDDDENGNREITSSR